MAPRKKSISQLAESTKKKNPSRVSKRIAPKPARGALAVPPHFATKEQKQVWAEVIAAYPGLNAAHKHLIELAVRALLRSRVDGAKSGDLALAHRILNQLEQSVIDYIPPVSANQTPQVKLVEGETYWHRLKTRLSLLRSGQMTQEDFDKQENYEAEQFNDLE